MFSRLKSHVVVTMSVAILGLGLASCGSSGSEDSGSTKATTAATPGSDYPQVETKSFTKSCLASAKASAGGKLTDEQITNYCKFSLECLERRLTFKRFSQYVANVESGKANPDAKVVAECVKEAGTKVREG